VDPIVARLIEEFKVSAAQAEAALGDADGD